MLFKFVRFYLRTNTKYILIYIFEQRCPRYKSTCCTNKMPYKNDVYDKIGQCYINIL